MCAEEIPGIGVYSHKEWFILKLKGKVYSERVRSVMMYGSNTWAMRTYVESGNADGEINVQGKIQG